ncbi:hypothetical protein SAMN02746073_0313 [Legionella jamestowniensis DSM 19215]|nr:hypothetical protein SAMN02746073_0313 [Legionella jamestowniensis DSM 19215]
MNRSINKNKISDKNYRIICLLIVLTYIISVILFIFYPYFQSINKTNLGYLAFFLLCIIGFLIVFLPMVYFVIEGLKKIMGEK